MSPVTQRMFALTLALSAGLVACRLPPPARSPSVGALAPDFALPAAGGGRYRLSDEVADGTTVLVFYRGHW